MNDILIKFITAAIGLLLAVIAGFVSYVRNVGRRDLPYGTGPFEWSVWVSIITFSIYVTIVMAVHSLGWYPD